MSVVCVDVDTAVCCVGMGRDSFCDKDRGVGVVSACGELEVAVRNPLLWIACVSAIKEAEVKSCVCLLRLRQQVKQSLVITNALNTPIKTVATVSRSYLL